MPSIKKNILANILGRGWSIISVFIFIPIYIKILGLEMYGIVSFYAILQGILIFADAGLTATLKRELAKGDESLKNRQYKFQLLKSIEIIYLLIVFAIITGIFFTSTYLATKWLNIDTLNIINTQNGIRLMGIALGFNFLSTLYQGGILGLEKQVVSNLFQITWGLLKNGGVILAILLIDKSLMVFFGWQIFINVIYVFSLRFYLIFDLKKKDRFTWSFKNDLPKLKGIRNYAVGMFIISFLAALNSQFDKLVLSKLLSVSELAIYTVAYSLSAIPVILSGPIITAIFPRFVKYFHDNEETKLLKTFSNTFKFILLLSSSFGSIIALYSKEFLLIWTQNESISNSAATPALFLIIGQTLLSFQVTPFNLALAKGNTKINIATGIFGIVILASLVIIMTKLFGMYGTSLSWMIFNIVITPLFIYLVISKMTNLSIDTWFYSEFFKPLILVILGNLVFFLINPFPPQSPLWIIIYSVITSGIIFLIAFSISFKVKIKDSYKFIKLVLFN